MIIMQITLDKKIRIEMIKRDVSGAEIARKVGVTRVAIYRTIDGFIKSYRLRKAIADAIGEPVEALWPEDKAA